MVWASAGWSCLYSLCWDGQTLREDVVTLTGNSWPGRTSNAGADAGNCRHCLPSRQKQVCRRHILYICLHVAETLPTHGLRRLWWAWLHGSWTNCSRNTCRNLSVRKRDLWGYGPYGKGCCLSLRSHHRVLIQNCRNFLHNDGIALPYSLLSARSWAGGESRFQRYCRHRALPHSRIVRILQIWHIEELLPWNFYRKPGGGL